MEGLNSTKVLILLLERVRTPPGFSEKGSFQFLFVPERLTETDAVELAEMSSRELGQETLLKSGESLLLGEID